MTVTVAVTNYPCTYASDPLRWAWTDKVFSCKKGASEKIPVVSPLIRFRERTEHDPEDQIQIQERKEIDGRIEISYLEWEPIVYPPREMGLQTVTISHVYKDMCEVMVEGEYFLNKCIVAKAYLIDKSLAPQPPIEREVGDTFQREAFGINYLWKVTRKTKDSTAYDLTPIINASTT